MLKYIYTWARAFAAWFLLIYIHKNSHNKASSNLGNEDWISMQETITWNNAKIKLLTFLNGVWTWSSTIGISECGCRVGDECRYIISWHQHRDPFWIHTYLQISINATKISLQSKKLISKQFYWEDKNISQTLFALDKWNVLCSPKQNVMLAQQSHKKMKLI